MKTPLVSIIVPFYNTGHSAQALINNLRNQSYENLQIIFVNDGSTDDTLKLLEEAKQQDHRIILINQKNSGSATARNSGLKKATGQYVMFFDSDDEVDPEIVEKMLGKIQESSSDMVTCGFKYHRLKTNSTTAVFINPVARRHQKEALAPYIIRLLGNDGRLHSSVNKIFRIDIIKRHKLKFDPKLNFGEDLIFVLNYLKYAQNIDFLYEPLYTYHYGTPTSTVKDSSLKYKNWQQNWQFLTDYFQPKNPAEQDQLNWIRYRWGYSYCLAVYRSDQTKRQKLDLLHAVIKDKALPPVGKRKHIGKGKYLQEKLFRLARKTPSTLYAFIASVAKIKQASDS